MLIDPQHPRLSVLRQCDLIGLPRSSLYYRMQGEDAWNQQLMRLIDRQYRTPAEVYGISSVKGSGNGTGATMAAIVSVGLRPPCATAATERRMNPS